MFKKRYDSFRVLDIGCGTGIFTREIAVFFSNSTVVGVDPNVKSLASAQEHPPLSNLRYIHSGFENVPSLDPFDLVICTEVYEHVENTSLLLDTLERHLAQDGIICFSTPSGWMYRLPSLYNLLRLLRNPRRYYRLLLKPESNWGEALKIHPAIQPSVIFKEMRKRGFRVINRLSTLVNIIEDERKGILYMFFRAAAKLDKTRASKMFYYFYMLLEALMNIFPPMRIFETRFIVAFQRKAT